MARLGVADPAAVAVVGDTVSDLEAGAAAGAGAVVGVLSGAHDEATLAAAPHTAIIADVTGRVLGRCSSPARPDPTPGLTRRLSRQKLKRVL